RQAGTLPMPQGVDSVTLPALRKEAHGWVKPRFLDVSNQDLIELRTKVIRSAIKAFEPDVLIVDHLPLGAARELTRTLQRLRRHGTRCVLGVRDVLQDVDTVHNIWADRESLGAMRDLYDAIWIYCDPAIVNPVREYGVFDQVAERVRFTGYLDQRPRLELINGQAEPLLAKLPRGRIALCIAGGGVDGGDLAVAFAQAELPRGTTGVIV